MRQETIHRKGVATDMVGFLSNEPLDTAIERLLSYADLDLLLSSNAGFFASFSEKLSSVLKNAFEEEDDSALFEIHKALYFLYEDNLRAPGPGIGINQFHPFIMRIRNKIETAWERCELKRIDINVEEIPDDSKAFAAYFKERCFGHRLGNHPLFDYLEHQASHEEMVNFFVHEGTVILRFCDMIVLSMIGVEEEVRGELAENFWDEMGNGNADSRHVELYRRLLRYVGVNIPADRHSLEHFSEKLGWQGLAGYNLYLNLCLHRRNYFRSVGGLGIAEMMDSPQYTKIVRGCERVGLKDRKALAYYVDHVEMDAVHGDGWLHNVMVPLLRKYPESRLDMLIGAEMRLNTGADYYDSLLATLSARGESEKVA